jgi:hypothetical protein
MTSALAESQAALATAVSVVKSSPSGSDRLVKLPNIALSDLILGDVRVRSVHKIGYGHDRDGATAQPLVA